MHAMLRMLCAQGLLVKFSEENMRLARENDKLRAGRHVLRCGTLPGSCGGLLGKAEVLGWDGTWPGAGVASAWKLDKV